MCCVFQADGMPQDRNANRLRLQHWRLRLICTCASAPSPRADEPGRPISRYQDWARSMKLPREGGYRWFETRLHGHHRRKSDSTRERPAVPCACL